MRRRNELSSSDDWKTEYEQLSEDFRFYVQMGWQAPVAVLGVDGLLVATIVNLTPPINRLLGFLPLMASILTLLMATETVKWILRTGRRVQRLKIYDRMKGFDRFYFEEHDILAAPLGHMLVVLMVIVGLGLLIYSILLFLGIQPTA